ncbi:hypothetical protein SAMN04515695_0935, partial [Pseudovibrio sp. Tun.PSC04-5.I4]
PLIAQPRQNPALSYQNCAFHLRLIFGFTRTGWNNRRIVMVGHIAIGAVDRRIIKTGLGYTRLKIVRYQLCGHAAEELKRPDITGYPIRQALRPTGFNISVTGGPPKVATKICAVRTLPDFGQTTSTV